MVCLGQQDGSHSAMSGPVLHVYCVTCVYFLEIVQMASSASWRMGRESHSTALYQVPSSPDLVVACVLNIKYTEKMFLGQPMTV